MQLHDLRPRLLFRARWLGRVKVTDKTPCKATDTKAAAWARYREAQAEYLRNLEVRYGELRRRGMEKALLLRGAANIGTSIFSTCDSNTTASHANTTAKRATNSDAISEPTLIATPTNDGNPIRTVQYKSGAVKHTNSKV